MVKSLKYLPDLRTDPLRTTGTWYNYTGINVDARIHDSEDFAEVDIAELDAASLLVWLQMEGGNNPRAENVIGRMLGHGKLVDE